MDNDNGHCQEAMTWDEWVAWTDAWLRFIPEID